MEFLDLLTEGTLAPTHVLSDILPTLLTLLLVFVFLKLLCSVLAEPQEAEPQEACKDEKALPVMLPGRGAGADAPSSTCRKRARSGGNIGFSGFSLVPAGKTLQPLRAPEANLQWFEGVVNQVNEVKHGIFFGEAGGAEEKGWAPGAFSDALLRLREQTRDEWPAGGSLHEPLDDVALASRLIATNMDLAECVKLVKAYRAYRAGLDNGGTVPSLEWLRKGIAMVPCEDRLGRPLIVIRARHHRPGNIELFRSGLRTTLDAVKAHLLHKRSGSFSTTNPLEQYALVWDFEGARMRNLDWEAFHTTIEEGRLHYPNMGSQIYVLNVSVGVRWVWSAASRLMHPKIARKCLLVSPKQVPACMRKLILPEHLPPEYGGTGPPWPEPSAAQTLEDQVGALAAEVYARAGVVPEGAKPRRAGLQRQCSQTSEGSVTVSLRPERHLDGGSCFSGIFMCCGG